MHNPSNFSLKALGGPVGLGMNARKFAKENFWSWEERIDAEVSEVSALVERAGER